MNSFLIIRLSSLGDIIHTLPAFAALRRGFPGARISWVVEKPGKEILSLVSGIDEIIVRGEKGWLDKIRGKNRTALDFQGLLKSSMIGWLAGSRRRIGFSRTNLREPAASIFYTDRLEKFPATGHVIDKNLRLLQKLGLEGGGYEFPLVIPEDLRQTIRTILAGLGRRPEQKIILCNVGAAWENKRWPAERWIDLLRILKKEGFFYLLLWGDEEERKIAQKIAEATGTPPAPFFSIREVMALIRKSALLISGDTFALQAACALDVPVVGLFGPTSPKRNGPFLERDRTVCIPIKCHPCYKRKCSSPACLAGISAEDVAALAEELIQNG